jgi:peptidoglycan/LPS O-acetylase OafA/YrhL
MSSYTSRYEIHVLIFLTLSVVLSFSGQTYGEAFWNQKWVYALGRISLPLYLCQLVGINVVCGFLGDFPKVAQTVLALAITLGMALLSIPVGDRIYRWIVDKRKATKYNKLNAPFEG